MSIRELPEGWIKTEMFNVADIVSGGTPNSKVAENFTLSGKGIAWLTPADLSGYKDKYIAHGARDLTQIGYNSCSTKIIPSDSILFSSRAPIGYVAIASNEISTNQGFKNFVFASSINANYAYYYIRSIKHIAEEMGTGTTFKEISGSSAKKLPFVIVPLTEQKIIAEKLDILLAQIENTKTRLEKIPSLLKRFRQAVLATAVSGKLTEEWRTFNKYSYVSIELGKIAYFIDYRGKTPVKTNRGIPLITAKNIKFGYISREPKEYIAENDYDIWMTRGIPKIGDILITTEAPLGNVAMININEKFALAQRAICLQLTEKIISPFALIYMQSSHFQYELKKNATGSTVKGIKAALLKKILINFPPLEEQHEIVRRVEQLFAYADAVEQQVNNALQRVNNLTQAILAKAFLGELTEQWRKDNPDLISGENSAAALLARIQAERSTQNSKKTTTKTVIRRKNRLSTVNNNPLSADIASLDEKTVHEQ